MVSSVVPITLTFPSFSNSPFVHNGFYRTHVMTHKQVQFFPDRSHPFILPRHFFWNSKSPTAKYFVDDQDLGLEVRRDGKGQPAPSSPSYSALQEYRYAFLCR